MKNVIPSHHIAGDLTALCDILSLHLPVGSSLLELGSGAGEDISFLSSHFRVTASDISAPLVEQLRIRNDVDSVLLLDAITFIAEKTFNCIFSNKLLQHLTDDEIARSLARQHEALSPGGIIAHTLWATEASDIAQHSESIIGMIEAQFKVLALYTFDAFLPADSLLIIAGKHKQEMQ